MSSKNFERYVLPLEKPPYGNTATPVTFLLGNPLGYRNFTWIHLGCKNKATTQCCFNHISVCTRKRKQYQADVVFAKSSCFSCFFPRCVCFGSHAWKPPKLNRFSIQLWQLLWRLHRARPLARLVWDGNDFSSTGKTTAIFFVWPPSLPATRLHATRRSRRVATGGRWS